MLVKQNFMLRRLRSGMKIVTYHINLMQIK